MNKRLPCPPRINRTIKLLNNLQADKFLDIGCGDGGFSVRFKEALTAKKGYGLEIAPEAAAMANRKGISTVVSDADVDGIPYEDGFFDVVVALEIIEHLSNPCYFIEEIYRVLKPRGVVIISTPNIASWHSRIHLAMGYQPYPIRIGRAYPFAGNFLRSRKPRRVSDHIDVSGRGGAVHIQFFTLRALKELFQRSNFKVRKVIGSPDMPAFRIPPMLRLPVLLGELLTSKFSPGMASTIIVEGIKQ